jgi:hypothetical protein
MTTQTGPSAAPAARDGMRQAADAPVPSAPASRQARVAILGTDAALELLLRESASGVSFVTAHTLVALADVMTVRPCDALVVDVAALGAAPSRSFTQLAAQFPDLPIVAVGSRTDEAAIAGLISGGQVYRFLHRPLSPGRARALLGAALRRHGASPDLKPRASAGAAAPPASAPARRAMEPAAPLAAPESVRPAARGSARSMSPTAILACGVGLALLAILAWWMLGATPR